MKVPSFPRSFLLPSSSSSRILQIISHSLADILAFPEPLFGSAEFNTGESEPEIPIAAETTVVTPIPVVGGETVDYESREGFSLLQKALFLSVIFGCVAVYLKMSGSSKRERRFQEKSLA